MACSIPTIPLWLAPYILHHPVACFIPTPSSCGLLHTYSILLWLALYPLLPPVVCSIPTPPSCALLHTYSILLWLTPTYSIHACLAPYPDTYSILMTWYIPTPYSRLLHTYSVFLCLAPYLLHPPVACTLPAPSSCLLHTGLLHTYCTLLAYSIPIPSYGLLHYSILLWLAQYLLHPTVAFTIPTPSSRGLLNTYSILLACSIPTPPSCRLLLIYSILRLTPHLLHRPGLVHTYSTLLAWYIPTPAYIYIHNIAISREK